jgi:hypothetical protein
MRREKRKEVLLYLALAGKAKSGVGLESEESSWVGE